MKKKDLEILNLKSTTHAQNLAKEVQETNEMQVAIASITAQRDAAQLNHDRLASQLESTKAAILARIAAQQDHAKHIDAQARHNGPELDFWQDYLCLRIEGAGISDRLKFVYSHLDERDWEREGWFELDCSTREYSIRTCRPKLEKKGMESAIEGLNDTRDLAPFLKEMRELFVAAMK
jgi:kinetochore protein Spc25